LHKLKEKLGNTFSIDIVNLRVNINTMKEIFFYKTESGKCPVEDFLNSLTSKQAQKVAWVLNLIEEQENVPSKFFKKMVGTNDLWEVRVNFKSDIFRILCFCDGFKIIVLTHGFVKKTQKTPKQAIKTAEKRMKDYLRRNSNE
jgi:phage-related protein